MKREFRLFVLLLTLGAAAAALSAQFPVITNQPSGRAVWASYSVTFSVGVSNAAAFTYQWQHDGTNLPNGIITTVVGNGTAGYLGDGGLAAGAELSAPRGVAADNAGNLFIVDTVNNCIRKVTNGVITTIAGIGGSSNEGYSGDGGAATNANLYQPTAVSADSSGNLFIADNGNSVIRKVDTNGVITTVAGNNSSLGYSGDGGPATDAGLFYPSGVAVDGSGDLFIADTIDSLIRKVDTNGIITTVAGSGVYNYGYGGDGGAATDATLNQPDVVAVDTFGNLFIADTSNNRVRKVDTNGIITTVVGDGSSGYSGNGTAATNASLNQPAAVLVDAAENLFVADTLNNVVREVGTNGIIVTVAGNTNGYSGDGGFATNACMRTPYGMALDSAGNLFIADVGNNCIRKITNTRGPLLALNNVGAADAGDYRVVVTGTGGSVTSSVATLTLNAPLITQNLRHADRSVALGFLSRPGSVNRVLCITNLTPPIVWQPISTATAGADGIWQFTDTNAASYQTRFYRSQMF
jgi:sugar lactone lactonase YvrE